jgi:hypothetical protein
MCGFVDTEGKVKRASFILRRGELEILHSHETTLRRIPDDIYVHSHSRGNLKSDIINFKLFE